MKRSSGKNFIQNLKARYRRLPADLRSRSVRIRSSAQKLLTLTLCVPLILWGLGYMLSWELTRRNIERDNAAFSALYTPAETAAPTTVPTAAPTKAPTEAPTIEPTEAPPVETPICSSPTPVPAITPTATPTATPTETPMCSLPTPAPKATPTPEAAPAETAPSAEVAVDATRAPLATPDANTLIYAVETPPPAQHAFGDLLALNGETVAFLRIGGDISLPVVQRPNDNEFYLNHSFNLEESIGGTLFLDGSNLLVPEDPSLVVYGHNMRNGTMFRPLIRYEQLSYLKENPLIRFDTIYENRSYVPFAVFSVTADPGSSRYVEIRQFMFDPDSWDAYIQDMRRLSVHNIPVDVQWGDHVLLLVTCEYTHNNGRFIVAARALRPGESETDVIRLMQNAG